MLAFSLATSSAVAANEFRRPCPPENAAVTTQLVLAWHDGSHLHNFGSDEPSPPGTDIPTPTEDHRGNTNSVEVAKRGTSTQVGIPPIDQVPVVEIIGPFPPGQVAPVGKGTPQIFDPEASYRILTRYGSASEIVLADYLAEGVTGVRYMLKSCDDSRGDYYNSASVARGILVLASNTLGHVHGTNTQEETVCTVTGTIESGSEDREYRLYTVSDRTPQGLPPGTLTLVEARTDEVDIRISVPQASLGYVRIGWGKTGEQPTFRLVSGVTEGMVLTIPGLEAGAEYEIRAYLMTTQAFDLYRGTNTGAPGSLILEGEPGSKWTRNLSGGGLGKSQTATVTTASEPTPTPTPTATPVSTPRPTPDDDDDDDTDNDGIDTPETDNDGFDTEANTDHDGIDTPETDNDGFDTEANTDHDGFDTPTTDGGGFDTEANTDHDGFDTPTTDGDGFDTEANTDHDGFDTPTPTDNDGTDSDGIDTPTPTDNDGTDSDGIDTPTPTDNDGTDSDGIDTPTPTDNSDDDSD